MHAVLARQPITVIKPEGYLNAATVGEFQIQLDEAFAKSHLYPLLVDMGKVEFLDSAGLLTLVSALKRAKSLNRRFSLCSISSPLRMIFELSRLDGVFEIFDNAADFETAIASTNRF